MTGDDEIDILREGWRLLGQDVQTTLLSRGWAVTDLDVGDDEPLELYWPPTAPLGYGHGPGPADGLVPDRPRLLAPRRTPWTLPTRITRAGAGWRVEHGATAARQPDPPLVHPDDASLLADLDRIEWWPMPVAEARRIQAERVLATTVADARDEHSLAVTPAEPYAGRMAAIRAHDRSARARAQGDPDADPPSTPRPRGDLGAQLRLLDAEAWASAVRTAQAGGEGWGLDGPGAG